MRLFRNHIQVRLIGLIRLIWVVFCRYIVMLCVCLRSFSDICWLFAQLTYKSSEQLTRLPDGVWMLFVFYTFIKISFSTVVYIFISIDCYCKKLLLFTSFLSQIVVWMEQYGADLVTYDRRTILHVAVQENLCELVKVSHCCNEAMVLFCFFSKFETTLLHLCSLVLWCCFQYLVSLAHFLSFNQPLETAL